MIVKTYFQRSALCAQTFAIKDPMPYTLYPIPDEPCAIAKACLLNLEIVEKFV
jgi:hypothetical protein